MISKIYNILFREIDLTFRSLGANDFKTNADPEMTIVNINTVMLINEAVSRLLNAIYPF